MDANVLYNQLDRLKSSIIIDLNNDLKTNPEEIIFSKTYYYVNPENSDEVYSIYGSQNGVLLVDSFLVGITALGITSLPIDVLIFIKSQIEHYRNLMMIRSRL
jgi:hypothetical protein